MDKRCDQCLFWKRVDLASLHEDEKRILSYDDRTGAGECRRYPPKIVGAMLVELGLSRMKVSGFSSDDNETVNRWWSSLYPITYEESYCGEFQKS